MMKQLCITILFLMAGISLRAQSISFSAGTDTNAILIGEQIKLTLEADLEKAIAYTWPAFPDSVDGLELVDISPIDTLERGSRWILQQQLSLTSFDSGYFAIPPMSFQALGQVYNSDAIGVAVRYPDLSQQEGYYDIKKPLEVPFNWLRIAIIVWIITVLLLIGIWLWLRFRKKASGVKPVAPEMQIPPHKYALMQLSELENEGLWQRGELKAYYSRLVDILRVYLERQMSIHAMENTAEEIIEDLQSENLPRELFDEMKRTLRLSAMVKFAKEKPGAAENETALNTVRQFVKHTQPGVESPKEKSHVE